MDLRLDDLRHPAVIALLQEHLDWMRRTSPPESVHALDLDALPGFNSWNCGCRFTPRQLVENTFDAVAS